MLREDIPYVSTNTRGRIQTCSTIIIPSWERKYESKMCVLTLCLQSLDKSRPQIPLRQKLRFVFDLTRSNITTHRTIQSIISIDLVLELTCSFQYILLHAYIAPNPPINENLPKSNTAEFPI
jgi:hypothetical protein